MIVYDLRGTWGLYMDSECSFSKPPKSNESIRLPGSTSAEKKGGADYSPSIEHMTEPYHFEGDAWFSREIEVPKAWEGGHITLFLERTRISTVFIDGDEIGTADSLCGFHEYDLSDRLTAGVHRLDIRVNNVRYKTKGGHMTSPDTQSNWNGIVGRIELHVRTGAYPNRIRVEAASVDNIMISAEVAGAVLDESPWVDVAIRRQNGETLLEERHQAADGRLALRLSLSGSELLWDEYSPALLELRLSIEGESASTLFGIRSFSSEGRRLFINNRQLFLRGKHDGLVFPDTGYAPMDRDSWIKVFRTVKKYGINHYRFHTCCPPEAAFEAADELGIYLEPELPFWGTVAAPGEEGYNSEEQDYLIREGFRILECFGNHPSFIMLSMGNELWGSPERIDEILSGFKSFDARHLYTQGSNNFQFTPRVLEHEDVFCGVRFSADRLFRGSYAMCDAPQGHIQTAAPDSCFNYDEAIVPSEYEETTAAGEKYIDIQYGTGTRRVKADAAGDRSAPQIPIISHEIGQYDFFPDITEPQHHGGALQPLYMNVYRERMKKTGIIDEWRELYAAAGKFAVDCYRREIETALRSNELSGFQLLDLQDFPGQRIASVGILNSWLEPKGFISPEKWREFCNDRVLLAELESFTVLQGASLNIPVRLSASDGGDYAGTAVSYSVHSEQPENEESLVLEGSLRLCKAVGRLFKAGSIILDVPRALKPQRLVLRLCLDGTDVRNEYELWSYPEDEITISESEIADADKRLTIAHTEDEARQLIEAGTKCILIPQARSEDIEGTYCTDFWNYPMFRSISESMGKPLPIGTLGLCIRPEDRLLEGFICESYSTPQWYDIVEHSHCRVLDNEQDVRIAVQPIDNAERCHRLGLLYYKGELPVCTSRLWEIAALPQVKAFARSLLNSVCMP